MSINPSSDVPIYKQIADDIRHRIAAGVYKPAESVPSLRTLALELMVNPNTVQRAYELLDREGLLVSRRGVGLFVAKRGAVSARKTSEQDIVRSFAQSIRAAQAAELAPGEIQSLFDEAFDEATRSTRSEA